jgi:hypothetical protein
MTTTQYQKSLQKELSQINRRIDMMILKGESYVQESQKHKILLRQMRAIQSQGFFNRLTSSMSF